MSQGQVPPQGSPNQGWRGNVPATESGAVPVSTRGKKLVGLLALLLALAGAVAALLFFIRPMAPPDFLSLAIRDYKTPFLPANALAVQDGLILEKHFATAGKVERPFFLEGGKILGALKDLRKKSDRPVVVHVCALARCADGKVYLLGGDADPDRPDTWVPLGDVLQRIRDCPAPGKLLILDIMRPLADARLGILADDIAAKIQAALDQEKDLPFLVLGACSPGQLSLVSEELGQSIFTYYLDQGLQGHADGHGPQGKQDQRITVRELAEFVKGRVDRWAWRNRGMRQIPILLGKGEDFSLIQVEATPQSAAAEITPPAYPTWLREGWAARDKGRPELSRLGPGVLRHLEVVLLRAEKRWRGGTEEAQLKTELQADLKSIQEQVQRIADSRRPPPPVSLALALAVADGKKPGPPFADTLRILLPKALDPALKGGDKEKAKKEEFDKDIKEIVGSFNKSPLEAAQALVAAASTAKLEPAQFLLLHQLLHSLEGKTRFAETVFLDRLKAFGALNDWDVPMPALQQALQAVRAGEGALAEIAQEPALLPWVIDLLKKADDLRRAGEKDLFSGQPNLWAQAGPRLQEAARLYTQSQLRLENLRTARATWDRALGLLPSLGPALIAQGKDDNVEDNAWKSAVTAAKKFADPLARPDLAGETGGVLESAVTLRQPLSDLERSYEGTVSRCLALGDDATGEQYLDIQALLESPRLAGPRREDLWKAGQELALRLHRATQALDETDNQAKPGAVTPVPERQTEREQARRKWRARQAIDTLKLAGYGEGDKLEALYKAALGQTDDAPWQVLAGKWGEVWPKQPLAEFKVGERNLAKADRLARLLSPFDLAGARSTEPGHWSQNPALALYRRDLAAFGQWLAVRYQAEGSALEEGSPFRAFYTEAAEESSRFAARMK